MAMRYRQISPGIRTTHIVSHYWTLEDDSSATSLQRIVPDGCPELILNFGDPFQSLSPDGPWETQLRCFFAGQITNPLVVRPQRRTRVLGVRLKPWGARALLQAPQQSLAGRITPVDDLLRGLPDRISRIEAYLARLCETRERDLLIEHSAASISARGGQVDLGRFAAAAGIGIRQWERRFLDAVGLPPKTFCRIQRFQRVFRELSDQKNWADTALQCGYYDQAHLIRDFQDLAGDTPKHLTASGSDLAWEMSHFSKTKGRLRA